MRLFFLFSFLMFSGFLFAQDVSLSLQKPPVQNPKKVSEVWEQLGNKINFSFGNSNKRYTLEQVPAIQYKSTDTLTAWKGEKVHTQLVLWANKKVNKVSVGIDELKADNGSVIGKDHINTGFVNYVMTDEFRNGCGHRKSEDFDSFLVADLINTSQKSIDLQARMVQPVWVSVEVPSNAKAGIYSTTIGLKTSKEKKELKLFVKVLEKTLPPPAQWSFNLDLWQHPAAIARVHDVELWSDKHFAAMKPYYTMLAKAGQKNITASIVDEPWNHQTYDDFPSLIKWTKTTDGNWKYDYTLFDKYVSFVMDCGIDKRINCYSMIPWKIEFPYFDEAQNKKVLFTKAVGTPEYKAFWKPMLTDFTRHLKEMGWFSMTTIAMDERPMDAMKSVIALLKEVDPQWKIALAGDYHPEIEADIYDYCVASRWKFAPGILASRNDQNKLSTWYTCCTEKYPNGFTFSPPAEHVWIGWYTAAHNMDGYLRWAYNSWPANPMSDSRFITWPAGDTYQVYPGPLTSIRFEKLIEGIQDFEKITILKEQYKAEGDVENLKRLDKVLAYFEIGRLQNVSAEEMVNNAKAVLN